MIQTEATPPTERQTLLRRTISLMILAAVFAIMACRQYKFVDRYAVNLMFSDQWGFYGRTGPNNSPGDWNKPESLWEQFDHQHGPHRMGISCLLIHKLADYDHWNIRWDSFAVHWLLVAAAVFGLVLAWCCGVRDPLAYLPIPLLYLTRGQWEDFAGASNMSHGSAPILLFTLYCIAWFIRWDFARIAIVTALTFLLIFTGFGIFVGLLTPVLFWLEGDQAFYKGQYFHGVCTRIALILVGLSWGLFLYDYKFEPAVPNFHFPWEKPVEYFYFIGTMLANFYGVSGAHPILIDPAKKAADPHFYSQLGDPTKEAVFGIVVMSILVLLAIFHGWKILRRGVLAERRSTVIFCLSTYVLLYCADTAVGRVMLGWPDQALTSRYVTLMIPAGLAIYLQLATISRRALSFPLLGNRPPEMAVTPDADMNAPATHSTPRRAFHIRLATVLSMLYALAITYGGVHMTAKAKKYVTDLHAGRVAWRDAYLATHDTAKADQAAAPYGFLPYPASVLIQDQLNYLEKNHLSFFARRGEAR